MLYRQTFNDTLEFEKAWQASLRDFKNSTEKPPDAPFSIVLHVALTPRRLLDFLCTTGVSPVFVNNGKIALWENLFPDFEDAIDFLFGVL